MVFLSFVQRYSDKAGKFLESNAPKIPCYLQVRLKHAPCGRGIPHAVLFDHKGKVVGTGSSSQLLTQVEALLKAIPKPPPPILGGIKVKYCKIHEKSLLKGKAIAPILKYLKVLAKKDDDKGKEAKALIDVVNKYVESKTVRLKKEAEKSPARTLLESKKFYIQIRTMSSEKEIKGLVFTLKKDRNVNVLANIMKKVDSTQAKIAKKGSAGKSERRTFVKATAALRKIIGNGKISDAVKNEAKEFMGSF